MNFRCFVSFFAVCILLSNCKDDSPQAKGLANNDTSPNSSITIIFNKRSYNQDTLYFSNGGYSVKNTPLISYLNNSTLYDLVKVNPNNIDKVDTLNINTETDVVFNHRYHYYYNSSYIFQPGDSVVFSYVNGAPYCTILNREVAEDELNFEVKYNLSNAVYTDAYYFYSENKRYRTAKEQKDYFDLLEKHLKTQNLKIDSLKTIGIVSAKTYALLSEKLKYRMAILDFNDERPKNIDLNDDDLLRVSSFRHFVKIFPLKKFKIDLLKSSHGATVNYKSAFDSVYESNLFSEGIKNYLLYRYLDEIATRFSTEDIDLYYKKFSSSVNDSGLIKKIEDRYLLNFSEVKHKTENVYLIDAKNGELTFRQALEEHKGKIVYVDFWASWCAPCRKSMNKARELKSRYKGKGVVFIYISIDKNSEDWVKAYNEELLQDYEYNFLALNYPSSDFYKEIQLRTIPRYLLFDKSGKLVHANAPKPERLEEELQHYLD